MASMSKNERFTELDVEDEKISRFRDNETGKTVAFRRFRLRSEEGGLPSTTIRQISLLSEMDHKNVASLEFISDEQDNATYIYVAFEYAGTDLIQFQQKQLPKKIENKKKVSSLDSEQEKQKELASDLQLIKNLLKQLLHGVAYYHSTGAVHGNLNPHNVLIKQNTSNEEYSLKITNLETMINTDGCYKAPELFLGSTELSFAADMFAVGCIFGEMLTKKPLFRSREGARDIFRLMGTPNEEKWPGVTELYERALSKYKKNKPNKDLSKEFPSLEPAGRDLLSKLLCLKPHQRITAVDALRHGYFTTTDSTTTTTAVTASSSEAGSSAHVNQ